MLQSERRALHATIKANFDATDATLTTLLAGVAFSLQDGEEVANRIYNAHEVALKVFLSNDAGDAYNVEAANADYELHFTVFNLHRILCRQAIRAACRIDHQPEFRSPWQLHVLPLTLLERDGQEVCA